MKLIQHAITSIVDATTRVNFTTGVTRAQTDATVRHAHTLRSRHLRLVIRKFGHWVRSRIHILRLRIDDRRALQQLLQLDERQLKDIGLYRGDLISVQLGAISLAELNAQRESRRRVRSTGSISSLTDGQPAGWSKATAAAGNASAKCA